MRLLWFAIVLLLMLLMTSLPVKAGYNTQAGEVTPQTVLR